MSLFGDDRDEPSDLPRNRRMVLVVCCPGCASLHVSRTNSVGSIAYWRCQGCNETWKEGGEVGRGNAKPVD